MEKCTLKPWAITFYNTFEFETKKRIYEQVDQNFKARYTGQTNNKNFRKILDACKVLYFIAPKKTIYNPIIEKTVNFKLSFLTLTLSSSQTISDKEITKQLLQPFLRHYRNTNELKHYVWKAEKQPCGNIHYHIMSDMFVTYTDLLNYWNRLQSRTDLIDNFQAKHGHRTPNSIDIKQVKNSNTFAKYMAKYMSKESDQPINGKIWDCSDSITNFKFQSYYVDGSNYDTLSDFQKMFRPKVLKSDYYTMWLINENQYKNLTTRLKTL